MSFAQREEIEFVFRAGGATYNEQASRILFGLPNTTDLMKRRDVFGVLLRAILSDALECVHLPGLIEFRRLGGHLEDLQPNNVGPYLHVMERDMRRFQFSPLGINMLRQEHLTSIRDGFDPHGRRADTFIRQAME